MPLKQWLVPYIFFSVYFEEFPQLWATGLSAIQKCCLCRPCCSSCSPLRSLWPHKAPATSRVSSSPLGAQISTQRVCAAAEWRMNASTKRRLGWCSWTSGLLVLDKGLHPIQIRPVVTAIIIGSTWLSSRFDASENQSVMCMFWNLLCKCVLFLSWLVFSYWSN